MAKHILIVDDEPDICKILRFNLELEGYRVTTALAPFDLKEDLPDLILLDVMMTPVSGHEWAVQLKSDPATAHIPIIFCTAKTSETDLLLGFALGSDDYICKPFRINEVKARVKAVLHRCSNVNQTANTPVEATNSERLLQFKGLCLDMDRKQVTLDGKDIAFTKMEFEILALLLSKPGQVFSRENILHTVWPTNTFVLDRTVDVNITRIRKKIGPYSRCLRTKFGYGYLFEQL